MDKHIYYAGGLLILALIAISFFIGKGSVAPTIQYVDKPSITKEITYDTIEKTVTLKPIYISNKSDTTIIIDNGQVITTKPFVATLDTILNGDTIQSKYAFPQDSFYLKLLPKPLVYKEINTITTKIEIVKVERPTWLDILSHTGAGLFGGLIGFGLHK